MAWTPLDATAHSRIWEHLNNLANEIKPPATTAVPAGSITGVDAAVQNLAVWTYGPTVWLRFTFAGSWSNSSSWKTKTLFTLPAQVRPLTQVAATFPFSKPMLWITAAASGVVAIESGAESSGISSGSYNLSLSWITGGVS